MHVALKTVKEEYGYCQDYKLEIIGQVRQVETQACYFAIRSFHS